MDDAALIALADTYEHSFEEGRSPLVREMAAGGGVEAAPRLAGSDEPKARLAAARLMHLLPDERHVAALEPLIADPDPPSPVSPGARCATSAARRNGVPPWAASPRTARRSGAPLRPSG